MIEVGKNYPIYIRDMSVNMEGIGEYEGRVFFVKNAIFGQEVIAKVAKIKKNIVFAQLVAVEKQSPYYVEKNDEAGGCMYSSLSYEGQRILKENSVRNSFQRISGIEEDIVEPMVLPEELKNYRNTTTFFIDNSLKKCGFYIFNSKNIVEVEECLIHSDVAMEVYRYVRDDMNKKGLSSVTVKLSLETKEVMIVFHVEKRDKKYSPRQEIVEHIEKLDEKIEGLGYSLESVYEVSNKARLIAGKNTILDKIGDTKYEIGPETFRQINSFMTESLYDRVRKIVEGIDLEKKTLLDLYCGTGSIGIYLRDVVGEMVGVDSSKENILLANRNAVINNCVNSYFVKEKSEDFIDKYLKEDGDIEDLNLKMAVDLAKKANIVILDPPRVGCDKLLLEKLIDSPINHMVYVSCNPATLARDVKILKEGGFELKLVEPYDNFPFTNHVECISVLER